MTDETTATEEEATTDKKEEKPEEEDSLLDDLIESIEEVVEKPAHWLFRKVFGNKEE